MPRPLHEPDNRNPTKIQINIATPVGADLCVGPLRTCRFCARAHTQVRPYMAADMFGTFVGSRLASTAARTKQSQPHQNTKHLCYPCRGRPMCRPAAHMPMSCTGAHTGAPLQGWHGFAHRSRKRAGRPSADRRSAYARTNTGIPVREAVRLRPLAAAPFFTRAIVVQYPYHL